MQLKVLRFGSSGALVWAWEEFLQGKGFYLDTFQGEFDRCLEDATRTFQRANHLEDDGVVGKDTWGRAVQLGFSAVDDDDQSERSYNWPPPPANMSPLSAAQRETKFGHIEFRAASTSLNPEAIEITNDFSAKIVAIEVPQLARVPGIIVRSRIEGRGPRNGKVQVHELVAQPMLDLWKRWEDEGNLTAIETWAGMWVPRFVRGSRTILSNHAYATAFDINAPWNGLRQVPALVGALGSVRKLVSAANELGWYWGGHFERKDGMHFEYVGG